MSCFDNIGKMVAAIALLGVLCGCPPAPLVGYPGPYKAVRWDTTYNEDLPITVFYPESTELGRVPLVVFNTGWNQPRGAYLRYGEQLAQWGYVCIIRHYASIELFGIGLSTDPLQVDQVGTVIDWAFSQSRTAAASPLYGLIDEERVGVSGHSLGGRVGLGAMLEDPRIDAFVGLDSPTEDPAFPLIDALAASTKPKLWIRSDVGICDDIEFGEPEEYFDAANPPAMEVVVIDSSHIDFLESSQGLNLLGHVVCGGGDRDGNEVRAVATRYMVQWFNLYLRQDAAAAEWFADVPALEQRDNVRIRVKLPENE